jgi:hypothetical protein
MVDSIDQRNKFKVLKLITGYTYRNSMEKQTFNYDGLFNLSSLRFNTVQGLNLDSGFSFTDWSANERKVYIYKNNL